MQRIGFVASCAVCSSLHKFKIFIFKILYLGVFNFYFFYYLRKIIT